MSTYRKDVTESRRRWKCGTDCCMEWAFESKLKPEPLQGKGLYGNGSKGAGVEPPLRSGYVLAYRKWMRRASSRVAPQE